MPIIKSAKKRVLQTKKAYERNKHYNTRMRTMVKNVLKATGLEQAEKLLPETYSAIDTAYKKNLIHKNNAARKKARVAKAVEGLKEGKKENTKKETSVATKTTKSKAKTTTGKKQQ